MQCHLLFSIAQSHGVTRSSVDTDTGSTSRPVRSATQPGRRHQKLHETELRSDILNERPSGMCDVPACIVESNLVRRAALVRDMARTYKTSK